ncbi:MAG TPA: hypothetical protein DDW81_13345, partial [Cryomorphaceae bacterium]|nr:hypothetical protein [Cryomorphaceae bacterium]
YYPSGIDSASASSGDYRLGVPVAITSHNIHPRTNLVDDPLSCWNGVSGSAANDCASLCDFSGRPAILDPLQTATFMDGMQRVVQVKKEVSKATGDTANLKQKLVSGITQYDRQGRDSTITLQTEELSTYALGKLNTESSNDYQAKTAYDYVSRPVLQSQIREASGSFSETTTAYEWNSLNGDQTFSTLSSTHGLVSRTYLNNKGQTLAVTRSDAGTTWFTPDPLNQLLKVIDPVGDSVLYQYDFMGQVTQEEHTDKGVTSYTYDKAGNMRTIERAEISPDYIEMDYHYNRLNKKTYPNSSNLNEVVFTYGSRNDGNNGAGRVIRVNEGTNFKTEIYKYDALGNRIYEEKVMSVPQAGARTFVTEFTYDDWGRIRQMVYPRGEVVDYSYGLAGELEGVNDNSMDNPVVDLILYDGFGNIQTLKYGNGTVTNFKYSDYSRRLKTQNWM